MHDFISEKPFFVPLSPVFFASKIAKNICLFFYLILFYQVSFKAEKYILFVGLGTAQLWCKINCLNFD